MGNRLLPDSRMDSYKLPLRTLPRSPGQYQEWVDACRGGSPAGSNFMDHSALVTEPAAKLRGKPMTKGSVLSIINSRPFAVASRAGGTDVSWFPSAVVGRSMPRSSLSPFLSVRQFRAFQAPPCDAPQGQARANPGGATAL